MVLHPLFYAFQRSLSFCAINLTFILWTNVSMASKFFIWKAPLGYSCKVILNSSSEVLSLHNLRCAWMLVLSNSAFCVVRLAFFCAVRCIIIETQQPEHAQIQIGTNQWAQPMQQLCVLKWGIQFLDLKLIFNWCARNGVKIIVPWATIQ